MKLVYKIAAASVALVFAGACTDFHRPGLAIASIPKSLTQWTFSDLELGSEVEGEASASCVLGFINVGAPTKILDQNEAQLGGFNPFSIIPSCRGEKLAKAGAAFNAAESGGYQYVVAARYETTTEDYFVFKKITVKIKGVGANVKSVRTLPMEALFPNVHWTGSDAGSSMGVTSEPGGPAVPVEEAPAE